MSYLIVTLIIMVCLAADLSPSQLGVRIHSDSQIIIIPAGVLAQFFLDHGLWLVHEPPRWYFNFPTLIWCGDTCMLDYTCDWDHGIFLTWSCVCYIITIICIPVHIRSANRQDTLILYVHKLHQWLCVCMHVCLYWLTNLGHCCTEEVVGWCYFVHCMVVLNSTDQVSRESALSINATWNSNMLWILYVMSELYPDFRCF